ncbi:copper resistance CopC family protein [Micromonospora sp. MW-13]|uniref:copper resistance CopC family protein n=1 Tax=Micromonospora sp. MW-13 TaxID=2094022 RepID=UPI000E44E0BE|nr:copper resistance CopC family protein [Micromonospora sp. MW-13]
MARLSLAALAAVLVVLGVPTPAQAHNSLRSADPARDATLNVAPTEIALEFTERLNPTFTTIVVTDAGNQRVGTGAPVVAETRGTVTLTAPLGNGTYTVAYRVVSADGHPVQGSYAFAVADPRSSTNPTAVPVPSGAATTSPEAPAAAAAKENGSGAGVFIGAAVLVGLVTTAGAMWWRRRIRR